MLGPDGELHEQPCRGLYCFIGAEPATAWLTGIALDEHGFVLTDVDLAATELGETWSALGRGSLPFETSVPGVFAVGDVRHRSVKRVAAAVGEGAEARRDPRRGSSGRQACDGGLGLVSVEQLSVEAARLVQRSERLDRE